MCNKSSGNKQIEKQEARVEVREEDSHDEEDADEVELRHQFEKAMENMPPQDNPEIPCSGNPSDAGVVKST